MKALNKLLKQFPWLWAIRQEWYAGHYKHIFVKHAKMDDFTTVINKNYKVKKIWVKRTNNVSLQSVIHLFVAEGSTVAEIVRRIIEHNDNIIEFLAIEELRPSEDVFEEKYEWILSIFKKPKDCEFKELFMP
ncbi:MAG: hypothetical protein NT116_00775 [Candidatus Parcubacteria bacterium]|nr:hypothetical protein [Candidatus Parcubacteria bacterium]